jgi:nucleoside phosphorylase
MGWRAGILLLVDLAGAASPARAGGRDRLPPTDPFCAARTGPCVRPPYVAVMSAFPAELEPLLAAAHPSETLALGDRTCHVGTLGGVRVVLVRDGIGLVNAATTSRALLDRFEISAIAFSGVAGSRLDIGDVAVPAEWSDGTTTFPVDASLLAIARTLAAPPIGLKRCTHVPPDPPGRRVCLDHGPRIVAGGSGQSADPFGGKAFPCMPGGGPVFGCDEAFAVGIRAAAVALDAEDMETAAVARVARDARVPFIAFRAVSDGGGDPLGLPGFPAQFFAYYRLAAGNAATVTRAFLQAWRGRDAGIGARLRARSIPRRVGAACDWERAVGPVCAGERAPRAAARRVARACAESATLAAASPGSARAQGAETRARAEWAAAAAVVTKAPARTLAADCRRTLVDGLQARAAARSP